MDRSTLRHHARPGGRYRRVGRGLYRLRHFPSTPDEHVMEAWSGAPEDRLGQSPIPGLGIVGEATLRDFFPRRRLPCR
jgi:hypothetical protein